MESFINLSKVSMDSNSDLWEIKEFEGETILQIVNNNIVDHLSGKVGLINEIQGNYRMQAEMRFLGHHLTEGGGGWFGLVMRAQDTNNYELVWFMPNAESENTVAYLSVAHGIVPWWTEAYRRQKKGISSIPENDWFRAQIEVRGDEFTLHVDGREIFKKKLTYYLTEGYPGFYVGTATDAAFRRIKIERLD